MQRPTWTSIAEKANRNQPWAPTAKTETWIAIACPDQAYLILQNHTYYDFESNVFIKRKTPSTILIAIPIDVIL